jgi:sugar phosphate isomerase/epimerase
MRTNQILRQVTWAFFSLMMVFIVTASASNKAHPKQKKDIYIQLYSVRDDIKKDFDGTISALAEMGYTGIEAANYLDGKFYGLTPVEFKNKIESTGMTALSSHIRKSLNEEIALTDWNEIWEWWDVAIKAHKAAGMTYIVIPSMPQLKTIAELKIYCDYYNQIGEKCNEAGLKFGYHNHFVEFNKIQGEVMYDYMLMHTDPKKVFFQMDVFWVVRAGRSPVEYFKKYPGRFELLHVKDNKELGQSGMVGFDAIFNNTDISGVRYLVVEVGRYNYSPLESVRISLDYLLKLPEVKTSYHKLK